MGTGPVAETHGDVFCTVCGHKPRSPDHAFCTECGNPLGTTAPRRPLFTDEVEGTPPTRPVTAPVGEPAAPAYEPEPAPRRRRGRAALLGVLVLILAGVGIGYALGHRGEDTAGSGGTDVPAAGSDQASGGASGQPSDQASGRPSATSPPVQPQDRLQQISRADDAQVRRLVGRWVPQLAAVTPGAGGDRSWTEALAHYQRLKTTYPGALLLDTGRWPHSYEKGGMYAVVIPRPGRTSAPALAWCRAHVHDTVRNCAAKLIDTSGSWADNFDSGRPGPD